MLSSVYDRIISLKYTTFWRNFSVGNGNSIDLSKFYPSPIIRDHRYVHKIQNSFFHALRLLCPSRHSFNRQPVRMSPLRRKIQAVSFRGNRQTAQCRMPALLFTRTTPVALALPATGNRLPGRPETIPAHCTRILLSAHTEEYAALRVRQCRQE